MDAERRRLLERQGYRVVGNHSAVKVCHWLREKLIRKRACYKEIFYGIECHRCLQMTPTVDQCNMNCLFCWRVQNFSKPKFDKVDDPVLILDECIRAQRELISGFKGDSRCDIEQWEEAYDPKHVAISLTGEPTFYSKLGALIRECHERAMSTFLVSNGTLPRVISNLDPLPTQLYITVAAPTVDIYKKMCSPMSRKSWSNLLESLDHMKDLDTRKVIRLTLVNGWNMKREDEYSHLIGRAEPDFVEAKGYVFVGASRNRMKWENMPTHEGIRSFSEKLSELTGYPILDERRESKVVLLGSESKDRGITIPVPF
ncbi:MAG: 4-demethylwyosine synthase TYW1 [Thermoplasmata archaeon]